MGAEISLLILTPIEQNAMATRSVVLNELFLYLRLSHLMFSQSISAMLSVTPLVQMLIELKMFMPLYLTDFGK